MAYRYPRSGGLHAHDERLSSGTLGLLLIRGPASGLRTESLGPQHIRPNRSASGFSCERQRRADDSTVGPAFELGDTQAMRSSHTDEVTEGHSAEVLNAGRDLDGFRHTGGIEGLDITRVLDECRLCLR